MNPTKMNLVFFKADDLRAMKDGRGKEPKNIEKCCFFLDKLEITEIRIKKSTQCMICEGDKNREYLRSIEKTRSYVT